MKERKVKFLELNGGYAIGKFHQWINKDDEIFALIEDDSGRMLVRDLGGVQFVKEEIKVCTKESFAEKVPMAVDQMNEIGRGLAEKHGIDYTEIEELPSTVYSWGFIPEIEQDQENTPCDFMFYLQQARKDFSKVASKYTVGEHLELRAEIDSFLIAYDQACDKIAPNQLPLELTAENGAKALLSGKFFEEIDIYNPEYKETDIDCEEPEFHHHSLPISWDTIKQIYSTIVKHYTK